MFLSLIHISQVSMNFWGFTPEILDEIWNALPAFLTENLPVNPEKYEFYLPTFVGSRLAEGKVRVRVLPCICLLYTSRGGEQIADVAEQTRIGRGVRAGTAPDRALVDADDLIEVLEALNAVEFAGSRARAV